MRHLFYINPISKRVKGKAQQIRDKLYTFFSGYPKIKYDIYESRWCRDAFAYIRRYVSEHNETIRVHAIGGTGTLFEVINSLIGFTNVEVASHPYGKANSFLKYFGAKNEKLFLSLKSQVFDEAIPIDIIRCGNNYGICYGLVGIEAYANAMATRWVDLGLPGDVSYVVAGAVQILSGKTSQKYHIDIDENTIKGDYASVMVANSPCYGLSMAPAIDAHPDDGLLEVYIFKNAPKLRLLTSIPAYTAGNYRDLPELVSHYTAKKVRLSSDEVMCMSIDGEPFYGTSIEYQIMPKAIRFVCPGELDRSKLPRLYGKPREGLR